MPEHSADDLVSVGMPQQIDVAKEVTELVRAQADPELALQQPRDLAGQRHLGLGAVAPWKQEVTSGLAEHREDAGSIELEQAVSTAL